MTGIWDQLAQMHRVDALGSFGRVIVMAVRIHVMARHRGEDPGPLLQARLRTIEAAGRMAHLVRQIGNVWPEKFAVSPPCCPRLSHDEVLLGSLADAVADDQRARFDADGRDMLDDEARDQLWRDITATYSMLLAAS